MALSPTNARYTASAARIATSSNYISTLDLHKPDRSEDFIKRYGSQNLTGLLEMAGAKAPATQSTFSHYEEEYIHNTIKVNAEPTEAGGAFDIKITAEVDVNGATADNVTTPSFADALGCSSLGGVLVTGGKSQRSKAAENSEDARVYI